MTGERVVVVGAGIGGLVTAMLLAARGFDVTVVEALNTPGGKARQVTLAGRTMDAGPTVLTLRDVFESIFAQVGARLNDHLQMHRLDVLARHAWSGSERLDLFADRDQSASAIQAFAGAREADAYLELCTRARSAFELLDRPFMRAPRPRTPLHLLHRLGFTQVRRFWHVGPFRTLWQELTQRFNDPRLRQLFGRYATYCGSSPFFAPATLMLVAHVEQQGVWRLDGGVHALALALEQLGIRHGATYRYGTAVQAVLTDKGRTCGVRLTNGETIHAQQVVLNTDASAVASGLLGADIASTVAKIPPAARSLSAITWNRWAVTTGFPLLHHSVFFSNDYAAEFNDLTRHRRVPNAPTVYICAQDRDDHGVRSVRSVDSVGLGSGDNSAGAAANAPAPAPERLLILVNAPACGDTHDFDDAEVRQCEERASSLLEHCGLQLSSAPDSCVATTPADFHRLFPGTGGALYGRASHGMMASFRRPGSRTKIAGLYLAGGSVHPSAGVPMAALSGQLAAASLIADRASTKQSRPAATPGGMSTR